ncbi:MAG: type II secretion system GspH family protein, partial [Phycisphaerae bacterium]|nr:type II secretion system GspH family protein [Phycisphaerae bacterium]
MAIKKYFNDRTGFTLMELLVVIAIIMMLIGILVPGIQGVKRIAKNLEQKSLFHNLEIGLETYRKDFGDFPESTRKGTGPYFTGAQHLAEAMVGRDSRGFEPMQSRKWTWAAGSGSDLYTTDAKSLARRKPLYVNLKDTGAFVPSQLYGPGNFNGVVSETTGAPIQNAPVLADMFYRKKILTGNNETVKVGSPILYFKANGSSDVFYKDITKAPNNEFEKWKFNFYDNEALIDLGTIEAPVATTNGVAHEMDAANFYKSIADLNAPFDRPLNETTFIL